MNPAEEPLRSLKAGQCKRYSSLSLPQKAFWGQRERRRKELKKELDRESKRENENRGGGGGCVNRGEENKRGERREREGGGGCLGTSRSVQD